MEIERKKTILIADDTKEIGDLIEAYLSDRPYRFLRAYDGKEALEAIRKEELDLVLLDIMMPELTGEQVLERLGKNYSIPIIVMTAKDIQQTTVPEYPCVKAVFKKPMSGDKLATAIDGLIGDTEPMGEI